MSDYRKELERTASPIGSALAAEFLVPTNAKLLRQVASASGWLWAFAAVSVVNLVLAHVQAPFRITLSVFASDLIYAVGQQLGSIFIAVALVFDAIILGCFVFLGFQMKRWRGWAFITGIVLLAIDAVLIYCLTVFAIWPFVLHGLAIPFLWLGLKAAKRLNERKATGKA
jgi:hypothetical protein